MSNHTCTYNNSYNPRTHTLPTHGATLKTKNACMYVNTTIIIAEVAVRGTPTVRLVLIFFEESAFAFTDAGVLMLLIVRAW